MSAVATPLRRRLAEGSALPVVVVVLAILAIWYVAAIPMNWQTTVDRLARAGTAATFAETVGETWSAERPVLPAPHQIVGEIWKTTVTVKPSSPRSLLFHAGVTLSSTLLGFAIGTLLGILLAVGIIGSRTLDRSLMPWLIASQTIPILAVAPMVIVVLNSVGIQGLFPKAVISTYLSFFPVAVGVLRGLETPDRIHLDLMRSYAASYGQTLRSLRFPAAVPHLLPALRLAAASAVVGAVVAEVSIGMRGGIGRMLIQLAGQGSSDPAAPWGPVFGSIALGLIAVGSVALVGLGLKNYRRGEATA